MRLLDKVSKEQQALKFNRPLILMGVGMALLCVLLSGWQWGRMQEKRALLQRLAAQPEQVIAMDKVGGDLEGARVWVKGEFLSGQDLLLDNRVRHGRPGYEWLTPLRLAGEAQPGLLLVNRGWLAQPNGRREHLPSLPPVSGVLRLEGRLARLKPGLVLKETEPGPGWPRRIQALDPARLERMIGAPLIPYQLQLSQPLDAGLEVGWAAVVVSPERHLAYAVQWALLALLLAGLTWRAGRGRE